jgi:hypothetical protein
MIDLIANTVFINSTCEEALTKLQDDRVSLDEHNRLDFNLFDENLGDYLNDKRVLRVLSEHKVSGTILFGLLECINGPKFWGYRFTKGKKTRLNGCLLWVNEDGQSVDMPEHFAVEQEPEPTAPDNVVQLFPSEKRFTA